MKWLAFIIFPFKAYLIIGISIWWIWFAIHHGSAKAGLTEATRPLALSYFICGFFYGCGISSVFDQAKRGGLKNVIFSIIAFILLFFFASHVRHILTAISYSASSIIRARLTATIIKS